MRCLHFDKYLPDFAMLNVHCVVYIKNLHSFLCTLNYFWLFLLKGSSAKGHRTFKILNKTKKKQSTVPLKDIFMVDCLLPPPLHLSIRLNLESPCLLKGLGLV